MPTAVAITSMLKNKKKSTSYKIYIIAPSLSDDNVCRLKKLQSDTCQIEIIYAKNLLENKEATLEKVTNTDYYRLMLDTILPNEDKVIALDGDILVLKDLSNLYNIDLEDNYVAGVYFRPHDVYNRSYVQNVLGLDEGKRINIGVMVMNLEKIRNDNIQIELTKNIGRFEVMSEDIINYVCKDKIKLLNLKYNYNLHFYKFKKLLKGDPVYTLKEYKIAKKSPVIFHYTLNKPWKTKTIKYLDWFKYLKISPYNDIKINLQNNPTYINWLDCVFSISNGNKHKIITILGLKIKIKRLPSTNHRVSED